ncbi:MAG: helix-turn-helix domain-containing protein [Patescibacteria group bacterium]|nr:helix-turn-helix domain-containing protein [Patescibacteria group bacterium]
MLTVAEILKNQRLKKGLTLDDIEKKTKIRKRYIEAIEKNQWSVFSSKIYIVGILKNYSKILDLDEKKILAFFRRDYEKKEEVKFKKQISSKYLNSETRIFFRNIIIFFFLFFSFYFGYQLYLYFSPPKATILSPKETIFKREEKIKIVGKTNIETSVFIFGQRVYPNKEGIFEYDFPLQEGDNKLIIELVGANGKKAKIEKIFTKKSPK